MLSPTYKKMVETVTGLTPLVGAKWKDFLRKIKGFGGGLKAGDIYKKMVETVAGTTPLVGAK